MFWEVTESLLEGFWTTAKIFGLTLLIALPLGILFSFASRSRFRALRYLMRAIVWIVRGTPLMLQLIVVYYGPGLIGRWASGVESSNFLISWLATWKVYDSMLAVTIAFVLNYSCYFSEIFRGGIESIPRGQYEAAQVLGMTKSQIFFKVVLMQVVKRVLAPMGNEIITLVKDTSLARTISVYELIWNAERFIKMKGLLWPLLYTGAFYLVFCGLLTVLFGYLEKKLNYYKV